MWVRMYARMLDVVKERPQPSKGLEGAFTCGDPLVRAAQQEVLGQAPGLGPGPNWAGGPGLPVWVRTCFCKSRRS